MSYIFVPCIRNEFYLARSANLQTSLYILLALISFLYFRLIFISDITIKYFNLSFFGVMIS